MPPRKKAIVSSICPYVGKQNDPASVLNYPSPRNYCHHCQIPAAPLTRHQASRCLTAAYTRCPIYLDSPTRPFPRHYISHSTGFIDSSRVALMSVFWKLKKKLARRRYQ